MRAVMSLWGMKEYDPTLFDTLVVPEGINKEDVVENLLYEYAGVSVNLPNAVLLKDAIGCWSRVRVRVWKELFETLSYEYDPISNYDRKESWHDSGKRQGSRSGTSTGKESETSGRNDNGEFSTSRSGKEDGSGTTGNKQTYDMEHNTKTSLDREVKGTSSGSTDSTGTDSTFVEGFNTGNEVLHDKVNHVANGTNSGITTDKTTETGSNNLDDVGTITDAGDHSDHKTFSDSESGTNKNVMSGTRENETSNNTEESSNENMDDWHEGHMYGNIGVTTTQAMIEEQRRVVQFDVIHYIIRDFAKRFLILVY